MSENSENENEVLSRESNERIKLHEIPRLQRYEIE